MAKRAAAHRLDCGKFSLRFVFERKGQPYGKALLRSPFQMKNISALIRLRSRGWMFTGLIASALIVMTASPLLAASEGLGDRFIPFEPSNHAASTILGPIIANQSKVRLENGRMMHLEDLGLPPIEDWLLRTGQPVNAYVHAVSGDLGEMRFGLELCKGGYPDYAVTRVSLSKWYVHYEIALFRGDSPPTSIWDTGLCAEVFGYQVDRSQIKLTSADGS